jgi:ornithine cyclodeaminase
VVALFDPETGAPVCVAHAGEITAIRTAATSAIATDALARADAQRLAVLGYGGTAEPADAWLMRQRIRLAPRSARTICTAKAPAGRWIMQSGGPGMAANVVEI